MAEEKKNKCLICGVPVEKPLAWSVGGDVWYSCEDIEHRKQVSELIAKEHARRELEKTKRQTELQRIELEKEKKKEEKKWTGFSR